MDTDQKSQNRKGPQDAESLYWNQLMEPRLSQKEFRDRLYQMPNWQSLKNTDGANPLLASLKVHPNLLSTKHMSADERQALHETDSQGRDLWFYILTTKSAELFEACEKHNKDINKLLALYPPRPDNQGQGWVSYLTTPNNFTKHQGLVVVGSQLLQKMIGIPHLQNVLHPGTEAQQLKMVQRILQHYNGDIDDLAERCVTISSLLRLMSPTTYAEVIPEMRYIGCLAPAYKQVYYSSTSYNGNGTHGFGDKIAQKDMRDLALSGLSFSRPLKGSEGGEPWSDHPPSQEWLSIRNLLTYYGGRKDIRDLEIGWRNRILREMTLVEGEPLEYEIPRI